MGRGDLTRAGGEVRKEDKIQELSRHLGSSKGLGGKKPVGVCGKDWRVALCMSSRTWEEDLQRRIKGGRA